MNEKAKILFVDNDLQALIALRARFRTRYKVLTASSGLKAINIIRRERIDVIVSAQQMSSVLGHELLHQVKAISPQTMRLLITSQSELKPVIRLIEEGDIFRFIHKPWKIDDLLKTIEGAIKAGYTSADKSADKTTQPGADSNQSNPAQSSTSGILVLDDSVEIRDKIQKQYRDERPIYIVNTVEEATHILSQQNIAVVLTDTKVDNQDMMGFIKLLKQKYPQVMTIVTSATADSNMAVDLINQAEVYRFLRKPVADSLLNLSVKHGLQFYNNNKAKSENQPLQLQVQPPSQKTKQPHRLSLLGRFLGQLKSISSRFNRSNTETKQAKADVLFLPKTMD